MNTHALADQNDTTGWNELDSRILELSKTQPALAALVSCVRHDAGFSLESAPKIAGVIITFIERALPSFPEISVPILEGSRMIMKNRNEPAVFEREQLTLRTRWGEQFEAACREMEAADFHLWSRDYTLRQLAAIARACRITVRLMRKEQPGTDFRMRLRAVAALRIAPATPAAADESKS